MKERELKKGLLGMDDGDRSTGILGILAISKRGKNHPSTGNKDIGKPP